VFYRSLSGSVAKHAGKQQRTVNGKIREVYGGFYFSQYQILVLELPIIYV